MDYLLSGRTAIVTALLLTVVSAVAGGGRRRVPHPAIGRAASRSARRSWVTSAVRVPAAHHPDRVGPTRRRARLAVQQGDRWAHLGRGGRRRSRLGQRVGAESSQGRCDPGRDLGCPGCARRGSRRRSEPRHAADARRDRDRARRPVRRSLRARVGDRRGARHGDGLRAARSRAQHRGRAMPGCSTSGYVFFFTLGAYSLALLTGRRSTRSSDRASRPSSFDLNFYVAVPIVC